MNTGNKFKGKIKYDMLYLPIEKKRGNICLDNFSELDKFNDQMDKLVEELEFEIGENTLVCISCTTSNHYLSSKLIATYFYKNNHTAYLVLGGAHATAIPNDFHYNSSPFDYIIIGEGEINLYNLIKSGPRKHDMPVILKQKQLEELNDLPPIDFRIIDKYIKDFNELSITLSRGCPYNCKFCMEKTIVQKSSQNVKLWRSYYPKRAIEEVKSMIKYGLANNIGEFGFYDPIFGLNKNWLKKFLTLYDFEEIKSNWIETRLDIVNKDLLKRFQKKNFFLMYGLESYSPEILKIMGKTNEPSKFLSKFSNIYEIHRDLDFFCAINIICAHPGETKMTMKETFQNLQKMAEIDKNNNFFFNIRYYHHFPGSEIYNNMEYYLKQYGSLFYIPEWWKSEKTLKYGPITVNPSRNFSIRESFDLYTEEYKTILNIYRRNFAESRNIPKLFQINDEVDALDRKREDFFKFLDINRFETDFNQRFPKSESVKQE